MNALSKLLSTTRISSRGDDGPMQRTVERNTVRRVSDLKIVQDRIRSSKGRVTACFDRRRNKAEPVLCSLIMFGLWIWRVFKFLYGPRLHSSAANPIATSFELRGG
jgi:hypothetical protein